MLQRQTVAVFHKAPGCQKKKKKRKSLLHANASETTYKCETEEEISPLKSTFEAAAGLSSLQSFFSQPLEMIS